MGQCTIIKNPWEILLKYFSRCLNLTAIFIKDLLISKFLFINFFIWNLFLSMKMAVITLRISIATNSPVRKYVKCM